MYIAVVKIKLIHNFQSAVNAFIFEVVEKKLFDLTAKQGGCLWSVVNVEN